MSSQVRKSGDTYGWDSCAHCNLPSALALLVLFGSERRAAEAKRAAYLAFKSLQLSSSGDVLPPDYHDHTIHSAEHTRTELKPGQIYRPSKPRMGTTPAERAEAHAKLEREQAAAQEEGLRREREFDRRQRVSQERWAREEFAPMPYEQQASSAASFAPASSSSSAAAAAFPSSSTSSSFAPTMHMTQVDGYNLPARSGPFAFQQ